MGIHLLPLSDHPFLVMSAILCAPFGVWCVYKGFLGKRTNDHPICRQCWFDLVELELDGAQGAISVSRCPECGIDLREKRAICDGLRKRRCGLASLGMVLLLISGAPTLVNVFDILRRVEIITLKPDWMLEHELLQRPVEDPFPLVKVFVERIGRGSINSYRVNRLVDAALVLQSDRAKPWIIPWGDLVEAAHTSGQIEPEKYEQFVLGAVEMQVIFPRGIQQGEPYSAPYELDGVEFCLVVVRGGLATDTAYLVGQTRVFRATNQRVPIIDEDVQQTVTAGQQSATGRLIQMLKGTRAKSANWVHVESNGQRFGAGRHTLHIETTVSVPRATSFQERTIQGQVSFYVTDERKIYWF